MNKSASVFFDRFLQLIWKIPRTSWDYHGTIMGFQGRIEYPEFAETMILYCSNATSGTSTIWGIYRYCFCLWSLSISKNLLRTDSDYVISIFLET